MNLLLFALFVVASTKASPWDNLTAKIVIIEFQKEQNSSLSQNDKIISNLVKISNLMNFTDPPVDEKIDMYIFPELSLGIDPSTSQEINLNDFPCNQSSYHAPLQAISCFAKQKNTYIVMNVVERVKCENSTLSDNENCKSSGFYFYNTNIVFDRKGIIAHRYRKYNLFGEKPLDRPDKPEVVTFKTDFGVNFGVFTCFDILFKSPAQDVLKQGIDGIIFPANWHSELPFLTALQSQQMFAYEHDVMLFASGGNFPADASGGTAVFRGSKDSLFNVIIAEGGTQSFTYESVNGEVVLDEQSSLDDLAKEMDAFPLLADNSLQNYSWIPLNTSQKIVSEEVCHNDADTQFCCNFNIDLTFEETSQSFYRYFLGAFSGVRSYPEICDSGIEVCAIVACLNSSISSCGQRFLNYTEVEWATTFNQISINARFDENENKTQFPNSLLASIRPIEASQTNWTTKTIEQDGKKWIERTFSTNSKQNRLLTFAIYGRNFELDVFPRDANNTGNEDDNDDNDDNNAGSFTTNTFMLIWLFVSILITIK